MYQYTAHSPIQELRFHVRRGSEHVALLCANANATNLPALRAAMQARGWQCVPVFADGREQLQVGGFKKPDDILNFLSSHQALIGPAQMHPEAADSKDAQDLSPTKTFLNHFSLQLAGVLNLIGDAGFLAVGIKKHDPYKIAGGLLYTLGGLNLALFGQVKPGHNVQETALKTASFLEQNVGQLPHNSGLSNIVLESAQSKKKNYLADHAAQNTLISYTLGAVTMLASGVKQYRADPTATAGLYYGIASTAAKTASLLIPEKAQSDKDAQGSKGIVQWVQEKPLRLFGYSSVVTDSILAWSSFQDHQKGQGSHWSSVTAVTYILADFLMAISNKSASNADGKLNADDQRKVEALAAETIASQSPDLQPHLLRQVAGFLAEQPAIHGTREHLYQAIAQQVEHQQKNPWSSSVMASSTSNYAAR